MTIPKAIPTIASGFGLFLCGFVLGAFTIRHHSAALAASSPSPWPSEAIAPTPASPQEGDDCVCLQLPRDYDLRAKLNGTRLPLDRANLSKDEQTRILGASQVTPLSDGRVLVGLCGSVYMLDSELKPLWRRQLDLVINDLTIVEPAGMVYVAASDNTHFILDAATGKRLLSQSYNGRGACVQVVPYGRDQCKVREATAIRWKNGQAPICVWRRTV